jgi:tetratricopeptide (TPR) repeat protein
MGAYRQVLRHSPANGSAREELAQACLLAERPQEAAEEYRILSESGLAGNRFLGCLGDARLMAGDASGATAAYRKMVTAHPDSIRVLYHLARLYESEGFKEQALAAYRRLRADGPWRSEAGWRAAALLAERGDSEQAEQLLRAVLAAEADNRPALWGLGRLLAVGGRYEQALPFFERLQHMNPEDYRPYFFLGKLYFRLQREEEAERAYEKYQIKKRRAELKPSAEENLDAVLRQFGELGE